MSQVMTTIVAPLDPRDIPRAEAALDLMGNPAGDALRARLDVLDPDGSGVHFVSMHALPSFTVGRAHLVLEFSADGDVSRALRQIVAAIGTEIACLFALAPDWTGADLTEYLTAHVVHVGTGRGQASGLVHSGSPGMSVGRILEEQKLAAKVATILAGQLGGMSALGRLHHVREQLGAHSPGLARADAAPPFAPASILATAVRTLGWFVADYLWPFFALFAFVLWLMLSTFWFAAAAPPGPDQPRAALDGLLNGLVYGVPVLLLVLAATGAAFYARLRRLEATDWISARPPDPAVLAEIVARENHCAQNHMVSLTELKGGWLRRFALRLAFWGIARIGSLYYRPGYLGPIGTIHFARWVLLPGSRDLAFLSNYGGSWQAYLEDFITLAHFGLTGVWSNTVGFPRSANLVLGGASDGERFKRYARQSMLPTRFWYSAYPLLITDMIRANAAIRRGLSGALSEDDAATWLCHFGSAIRPDDKLVTSEIQSLLFGGLGFLNYSAVTLWTLPPDIAAARRWLAAVAPEIAWNDGRRVRDDDAVNAIVQLALSHEGLAALGLPAASLASFPSAFIQGMTGPGRDRILGDRDDNAVGNWWWGARPAHAAVVVYGQTEAAFHAMLGRLDQAGAAHGATREHQIDLMVYDRADNLEPFGFRDGLSQPVVRGTYKGLKSGDPLHLVEPGEFILGYPDDRGDLPPGPRLAAIEDPGNMLPVLDDASDFGRASVNNDRDLGHNGSFLVIRQLEQDRDAFDGYCAAQAERLRSRLGPPYKIDAEFIAAKLMGRWRNGSPLVRAPYSASHSDEIIEANHFMLGEEDPEGLRCPFGAHIRRANPRDSLNPGSMAQVSVSNRHRLMRVGRKYRPEPGQKPGLLFMGLVGDIERQFEFVQQSWLLGNIVSLKCPTTLSGERDPVLHGGPAENNGYTIPSRDGPVKLEPMQRFVTMRGGGYFFLPGKRLVRYLSEALIER